MEPAPGLIERRDSGQRYGWLGPGSLSSSLTPGYCGTDLWASHRDCWHTPEATSRPASQSSPRWQWAPPGTGSGGRSGSRGGRIGCRGRGPPQPPPWLPPVTIIKTISDIYWRMKIQVCSLMENIFIMICLWPLIFRLCSKVFALLQSEFQYSFIIFEYISRSHIKMCPWSQCELCT